MNLFGNYTLKAFRPIPAALKKHDDARQLRQKEGIASGLGGIIGSVLNILTPKPTDQPDEVELLRLP
ncbi:hypothetical protein GN244_ATG04507 [Phytophthora infestans]|uniref:Uncharacterized protein n=1 Tax=Phytophthora infestans TaxID=4787 RepID=A0A833TGZ4_PHYIN|nr:hypothetical protein GN244_ATG04507 [Phytophthora infestans]